MTHQPACKSPSTCRCAQQGASKLPLKKLRSTKVLVSLNAAELANLDTKREPGEPRAVCLRRLAEVE